MVSGYWNPVSYNAGTLDKNSIASGNEYVLHPKDVVEMQSIPADTQQVVSSSGTVDVSVFNVYFNLAAVEEDKTSSDQFSDVKEDLSTQ